MSRKKTRKHSSKLQIISKKRVCRSSKPTNTYHRIFDQILHWLSGTFVIPRMAVVTGLMGAFLFLFIPKLFHTPPQPQPAAAAIDPAIPLNIEVPRLNVNLPIKEATVSANDWQVYDNTVSWLRGSGNLLGGNIVMYGHNSKTLFGKIIQLGVGDQILLKGSGGTKTYIVEKSYQTNRKDLSAVTAKSDQLTMYTCSGWFDANRWFVVAKPLTD